MKENEGALAMVITGERLEYYYLIIVFSGTLLNIWYRSIKFRRFLVEYWNAYHHEVDCGSLVRSSVTPWSAKYPSIQANGKRILCHLLITSCLRQETGKSTQYTLDGRRMYNHSTFAEKHWVDSIKRWSLVQIGALIPECRAHKVPFELRIEQVGTFKEQDMTVWKSET